MNRDHPCFRCVLPDCDETHARCRLRHVANIASSKRRRGLRDSITPLESEAEREIYNAWAHERRARKSEQATG